MKKKKKEEELEERMEYSKYIKISRFVIGICIVILVILLCTISIFRILLRKKNVVVVDGDDDDYQYRYLNINPTNNVASTGFMTLTQQLEEHEFVSYENGDGSLVLISNFGDTQYQCSGFCYCKNSIERRRYSGGSSISKGMTYLLVAVTSSLAYELTKTHFSKTCSDMEEFKDCPTHVVKAEVEDCEEKDGNLHYFINDQDGNMRKFYQCTGSCMTRIYTDGKNKYQQQGRDITRFRGTDRAAKKMQRICEKFNCEKLKIDYVEIDLKITQSEMMERWLNDDPSAFVEKDSAKKVEMDCLKIAKDEFTEKYLHPTCVTQSAIPLKSTPYRSFDTKKYVGKAQKDVKFPRCVGFQTVDMYNPSVKCIEQDPMKYFV